MSTSLQRIERGGLAAAGDAMTQWEIIRQQASVLVGTGFLPSSIKSPEQAMAIILQGQELGIGTMAALNNIVIIQGKPTVAPQLMLALARGTREIEDISIQTGNDGATVTIKRRGQSPYTTTFGPAEAKAMGLEGKDNYKKQPATMYQWRALAANLRVTFSDVVLGLYTPDEMGAVTKESGEIAEDFNAPSQSSSPIDGGKTAIRLVEAEAVIDASTANAISALWPDHGFRKGGKVQPLATFLKEQKGVAALSELPVEVGSKLLEWLQQRAIAAQQAVPTIEDKIAAAKTRLLASGVTEEQYNEEFANEGANAEHWLAVITQWAERSEAKAAA